MKFSSLRTLSKSEFKLIKLLKPIGEYRSRFLVVNLYGWKPSELLPFGLVVPRYIGKAVTRNRLRRLIREALITAVKMGFSWSGGAIVILTRKDILRLSSRELMGEVLRALRLLAQRGLIEIRREGDVMGEELLKFYSMGLWDGDETSVRRRSERATELLRRLIFQPEVSYLLNRLTSQVGGRLRVLDLFSGRGVGAIALSNVIKELNLEAEITLLDIRTDALEYAVGELKRRKVTPRALAIDYKDWFPELDEYHLIITWGNPFPHLSPWELSSLLPKLARGIYMSGGVSGLFIGSFTDLKGYISSKGYKEVALESEEPVAISLKAGFNELHSKDRRIFVRVRDGFSSPLEFYHWGVADLGALFWHHFSGLKIMRNRSHSYLILAYFPRRVITPQAMNEPHVKIESL